MAERETTTITEQDTRKEKIRKTRNMWKSLWNIKIVHNKYKSNNSNSNDMPLTNRPDTPKSIRKNNSIKHTHTYEHNNKYTKNYHSLVDSVARSLFSNTQNTFSRQWHARVYYGCDTLTCACRMSPALCPNNKTLAHSSSRNQVGRLVGVVRTFEKTAASGI